MARRKTSFFEDLFDVAAKMPWWISAILAIVAYFVLRHYATASIAAPANVSQLGTAVGSNVLKVIASILQYVIPLVLGLGAAASAFNAYRRGELFRKVATSNSSSSLGDMSWQEFEAIVGEGFRQRGFSVAETGGGGADGGVDLELRKGSELHLVQCKQWRAYKVPVTSVRELYGVMVKRGAAGGFVVTSGRFTDDAKTFANGINVELIDGPAFFAMVKQVKKAVDNGSVATADSSCPVCGKAMVLRLAKKGPNAGNQFWGCSAFPACRGTRS